ncbi:MAG: site-specific integrase [Pontiella sp.]
MKTLIKRKYGTYQAKIRLNPNDPIFYRSLDTKNKAVARKRLDDLYDRLALEKEGMIEPMIQTESKTEPIIRHLSRYLSDLETTASNKNYIRGTEYRLRKLFLECEWTTLRGIKSIDFIEWRSDQVIAIKTLNAYLSSLNSFLGWLVGNEFLQENPISNIKHIPLRGRHSFRRRAFTDNELDALLSSVSEWKRNAYIVAVTTGLRRNEIEQLEVGDLDIVNGRLLLRGEMTKNGETQYIPLHGDAYSVLRSLTEGKRPEEKILRVPHIDTFKEDLKKAGIEYQNARKERADFHSLRHTFCTRLARTGIAPQAAKELMRHSDIKMTTQIYTDVGQLEIDSMISKLPSLFTATNTATKELKNATKTGKNEAFVVMEKLAEMLGIKEVTAEKEWCSRWESNPHGI